MKKVISQSKQHFHNPNNQIHFQKKEYKQVPDFACHNKY